MAYDIIVVGGGPVGSRFARGTAREYDTAIVEEHSVAGTPVQCAGLVSPRVVGMTMAEETVLNELRGANIHFPGGRVVEIHGDEAKAVVIDRMEFDRICHEKAVEGGADFLPSHTLVDAQIGKSEARLKIGSPQGEKMLSARLAIDASGYKSALIKSLGMRGARETVRGIQVDVDADGMGDSVEVFLGKDVAPGFFGWCIPCGDFTRIGVCVLKRWGNPSHFLQGILRRAGFDGAARLRTAAGVIPLGTIPKSFGERLMVVGDAAGQAKPLSGGGLYTGLVAADIASRTGLRALGSDDLSEKSLSAYEKGWKGELGRELDRGYRLRKVFLKLNDRKLDELGEILQRQDVRDILSTGDIDRPSMLAPQILRLVPSLLRFSPQVLGSLLTRG